uniref:Uncharacterized protein n=1 Tax=Cacopsylla melanoneura TaxID=428564 RepID=A0A8D8YYD3_9HEMI
MVGTNTTRAMDTRLNKIRARHNKVNKDSTNEMSIFNDNFLPHDDLNFLLVEIKNEIAKLNQNKKCIQSNLTKQINDLLILANNKCIENDKNTIEIQSLNTLINSLEDDRVSLENKLTSEQARVNNVIDENDSQIKECNELIYSKTEELKKLKNKLEKLQEDLSELKNKHENVSEEKKILQKKYEDSVRDLSKIEKENNTLQYKLGLLHGENAKLQEKFISATQTIQDLQDELMETKTIVETLQNSKSKRVTVQHESGPKLSLLG